MLAENWRKIIKYRGGRGELPIFSPCPAFINNQKKLGKIKLNMVNIALFQQTYLGWREFYRA